MSTTPSIAEFWDAAAGSFDEEADHGLRDPQVEEAWAGLLSSWMPDSAADVLDLGCGTGSLSLLLARQGHRVVGLDLSASMVEHARRKIIGAGFEARLLVGDAEAPPAFEHNFDVVLGRHLLWTLPDPVAALRRWIALARPGGRLVLIEGRWDYPSDAYAEGAGDLPWMGGVRAGTLAGALRPLVCDLHIEPLTDARLWGRAVADERYAIIARMSVPKGMMGKDKIGATTDHPRGGVTTIGRSLDHTIIDAGDGRLSGAFEGIRKA